MKNTTKYGALLLLSGGIAGFVFFFYYCSYHFLHKEQISLFLYTAEALSAYAEKPGVVSGLAGDFLTQFFRYPGAGPALSALLILLLGRTAYAVLRKALPAGWAMGAAALIAGWEALRVCGLLYPAAATISLIGGGGLFLLYDRIREKIERTGADHDKTFGITPASVSCGTTGTAGVAVAGSPKAAKTGVTTPIVEATQAVRAPRASTLGRSTERAGAGKRAACTGITGLAGIALGYWWFGYGAFFLGIAVILSLLKNKNESIWAVLIAVELAALPALAARTCRLTYLQACQYPATRWWDRPHPAYERLLALDFESHAGNWREVRKRLPKDERITACSYLYNLANAAENRLPDRLLQYYQPAAEGLFMPVTPASSYLSSLYAAEVWFRLGDMTMAEHATLLGMIFSPAHTGSRMIRRLAEINLINGDAEAARKYLRILSATLFDRPWARDRLPGQETEQVKHWLAEKRALIPRSDTIRTSTTDVVRSLRLLLDASPHNRAAYDYLLCYHLLAKDIPSFLKDYRPEAGKAPERLYAEALLVDLVRRRAGGEEIRQTIVDPAVVQDFKEYSRMQQQSGGNPSALAARFGRTYWFYYHYAGNP